MSATVNFLFSDHAEGSSLAAARQSAPPPPHLPLVALRHELRAAEEPLSLSPSRGRVRTGCQETRTARWHVSQRKWTRHIANVETYHRGAPRERFGAQTIQSPTRQCPFLR